MNRRLHQPGIWLLAALVLSSLTTAPGQAIKAPFALRIAPASRQARAGQQVSVHIAMTNLSDAPIDCSAYVVSGTDTTYEYDIRNVSGQPIPHRDMSLPRGGSFQSCTLDTGETVAADYLLSWMYPQLLTPGKYTIQVSRETGTGPESQIVHSNAITIEVKP